MLETQSVAIFFLQEYLREGEDSEEIVALTAVYTLSSCASAYMIFAYQRQLASH